MSGETIGLLGGIVGALVGVAGGIVGTRASLRSAATPAERRAVVRFSIVLWSWAAVFALVLGLFLAGLVPDRAWWTFFLVTMTALGPAIALANRSQRRAAERDVESAADGPADR